MDRHQGDRNLVPDGNRSNQGSHQDWDPHILVSQPPPLPPSIMALIQRNPWIWLVGIWALMVFLSGIAITLLLDPKLSQSNPSSLTPAIAEAQPQPRPLKPQGTLPLWSLGAIATSCAIGCIAISQRLKTISLPSSTPWQDKETEVAPALERTTLDGSASMDRQNHRQISDWLRSRKL